MLKITKKLLNASLALLLVIGLGGCTATSQSTTHKAIKEPTSAKTVKQPTHRKSVAKGHQQSTKKVTNPKAKVTKTTAESSNTSTTQVNAHNVTQQLTGTSKNAATTNSNQQSYYSGNPTANGQSSVVTSSATTPAINSSVNNHQEIQLGLGDVAVWTDSYGITHHVNSDGMDRQTIAGSTQVKYEDWFGPLPAGVQVIHNGNYPHDEIQLGLNDVAVWTDSYGITHHVDSDGMDRQTIAGSSQIHYENWSGALPIEAQVIYNN